LRRRLGLSIIPWGGTKADEKDDETKAAEAAEAAAAAAAAAAATAAAVAAGEEAEAEDLKVQEAREAEERKRIKDEKLKLKEELRLARFRGIKRILALIQAAESPQALLLAVVDMEESIQFDKFLRPMHKNAFPYEAVTCSSVAMRLFGIDRAMRWCDIDAKFIEGQYFEKKDVFPSQCFLRPHWQMTPRCVANSSCTGPIYHTHRCCSLMHYNPWEYSTLTTNIRHPNFSRHHDLVDIRNLAFQVPQGAEFSIEECVRLTKEWEKDRERRLAIDNAHKKPAKSSAAASSSSSKAAAAAPGSDDEDDPDAARGVEKRLRRDTTLHHIDLEQGYRPRQDTEVLDLRKKL